MCPDIVVHAAVFPNINSLSGKVCASRLESPPNRGELVGKAQGGACAAARIHRIYEIGLPQCLVLSAEGAGYPE
jgi:hypothetical protein